MKLMMLFYLEDDGPAVTKLLADQGIGAYSRLPVEGRGEGKVGGWYGEVAAHSSKMILTVVTEEQAEQLLSAVEATQGQDVNHPIHAAQVDLEAWVHSRR
jgi:hypothetical protein